MDKKLTTEQAERLLKAIFAKDEKDPNEMTAGELEEMTAEDEAELADDNYPETIAEKVGYAEYVMIHTLHDISPALQRLTRLHRLLAITEKSGELPDIITNNEVRMALKPLLRIEQDIKEITEMLVEIYKDTKRDATEREVEK